MLSRFSLLIMLALVMHVSLIVAAQDREENFFAPLNKAEMDAAQILYGKSANLTVKDGRIVSAYFPLVSDVDDETIALLKTLTRLERLTLISPSITQVGFDSLFELENLETLGLYNLKHEKIQHLQELNWENVFKLKKLRSLRISSYSINRDLLKSISLISNMKSLSIDTFGGVIEKDGWDQLGKLKSLKKLALAYTSIDDASMEAVGRIDSLVDLNLAGCKNVDGSGLVHLSHLKRLKTLNLGASSFDTKNLEYLHQFPKLERLEISPDQSTPKRLINREDMACIAECERLEVLSLWHVRFGVHALRYLADMESLRELHLHQTNFSDSDIPHVSKLPNLKFLNLTGTNVTRTGIGRLRQHLIFAKIRFSLN